MQNNNTVARLTATMAEQIADSAKRIARAKDWRTRLAMLRWLRCQHGTP